MEKDLNKAVLSQINIPEDTAEIFAETAQRFEELMMMYLEGEEPTVEPSEEPTVEPSEEPSEETEE